MYDYSYMKFESHHVVAMTEKSADTTYNLLVVISLITITIGLQAVKSY